MVANQKESESIGHLHSTAAAITPPSTSYSEAYLSPLSFLTIVFTEDVGAAAEMLVHYYSHMVELSLKVRPHLFALISKLSPKIEFAKKNL